ncbi:MAG TPA: hypothetical protein DDY14_00210, partial [Chromatiaceae bacterium]|nr:hypothetical protein [Chromatiaceae bacterium]
CFCTITRGDFYGETCHLACHLVRRLDVAKTNENPAPVGTFLSGNRLNWHGGILIALRLMPQAAQVVSSQSCFLL